MDIQKLTPCRKEYIWGTESWELSFHNDGMTKLSNGNDLASAVSLSDIGENANAFETFPQLIKIINAESDLSVQVHPSDAYALQNEKSLGKTEMWYIADAKEGAGIYLGFKRKISYDRLKSAVRQNTLTELLNFYPVKKGESYFVPAGTVHAIGKGCVICEVQQNSNITYRVYDYGRKDANGCLRQLHIEKALDVIDLDKFDNAPLCVPTDSGDIVALSKYFTVKRLSVKQRKTLFADKASFKHIICLDGSGSINGKYPLCPQTSYFVPAGFGEFEITGNVTCLTSEVRKYYIGIDLGGSFIKGGIVDDLGNIVICDKAETQPQRGEQHVVCNIEKLCAKLCKAVGLTYNDISSVGMGIPGTVDSDTGTVIYSNNLGWQNFDIAKLLRQKTGLDVKTSNDANAAALGECLFGSGKYCKNTVMLTLGTGVGGGIVINGSIYAGSRFAGAELGHSVIVAGGEKCTCGRCGCLEAYASATALIRDTKLAMKLHPKSKMWQIGDIEKVDGTTAFVYAKTDSAARLVVDNYIKMLGCGIVNIANALRPELIILGGGICNEGDTLIKPLQKILDNEIFGGNKEAHVNIVAAALGNRAGILGAAALCKGL